MKGNKFLSVASFIILFSYSVSAQRSENSLEGVPIKDRLIYGGYASAAFGDYTYIELSPNIGYRVTKKFHTGVGFTYLYYEDKYWNYRESLYGANIYGRYFIFKQLFGIAQLGFMNGNVYNEFGQLERKTVPNLWIGGGYAAPLGGNGAFLISIMYDVIDDPYSFYTNPSIQIGFGIGF